MKRVLFVSALLVAMAAAGTARASTLIDFYYSGLPAGHITLFGGNVSTTNVPITGMTVSGAPAGNGGYVVTDGVLAFDTLAKTISITGTLNATTPVTLNLSGILLSGSISSFSMIAWPGGQFWLTLGGSDTKNPELLAAIGLAPDTAFAHFGFMAMVNPVGGGTGFEASGVDINNTTVPDAGSTLLLFGIGLAGLRACRALRR